MAENDSAVFWPKRFLSANLTFENISSTTVQKLGDFGSCYKV